MSADTNNILTLILIGIVLCVHVGTGRSQPEAKYKIDSVLFEGNEAFPAGRLHNVMISRPSTFFHPSYYHPEVFEDDLKNLQLFYRQQGYLEASIDTFDVFADTTRHRAHVTIQVTEGVQTFVEGVDLFGNLSFPDKKLYQQLQIHNDDPLKQKKVEQSTIALLTLYANHGFLDAQIEPSIRVNSETHRAIVDFYVKEGKQFRIDRILITGTTKTQDTVIRRELRFRTGEIVNYSRLLESQRRLYLTGLFQSVFVRPTLAASGDSVKKDILIEIQENMSGEFNVSVGYGSVEKARSRMEIYNHNLWGTARQIGYAMKVSFVGRKGELSFTEPWTFGTPWRTDINAAMEYAEEPGYNLNRIGGRIMLGRQFLQRSNATITYKRERVDLSKIEVSEIPDKVKTNTNSLQLSLIYDSRDNLFNSTSGSYAEWSNEIGRFFSTGAKGFVRSTLHLKRFHAFSRSLVLGTAIEVGWMDARGGLPSIPLHERFYSGGPNDLRAFDYRTVGPVDEDRTPVGGRLKFTWNLIEIRRTLYKMIGVVLFTDIGTVWDDPEQARIRDLRLCPGIGLRVNTPVGLARLDWAINVDRKTGEPATKFYFSMGQAF
jgi:outer membrane protein insertion porin family